MKKTKFLWMALVLVLIVSICVSTVFAATEKAAEPSLAVKTTSLELENAVYMNFKVQSQNISDTSSVKLLVWESYPGEYVKGTEDAELSVVKTEAGTGYLVFQYTDLAAKDMTKFVYVCAYANINGKDYYSNATKFSIVQYAYNTQINASASESLKTLVNDMLVYGASAQTYFNYKTDFLATDPIVKIRVEGGAHADGFKTMYYKKGSTATFIANAPEEGYEFSHWKNSAGISVGKDEVLHIPVNADDTYTALYRKIGSDTDGLIFTLSADGSYYIVSGFDSACLDTEIVIPSTYGDSVYGEKAVKEIGQNAFFNKSTITSIIIPDSVTSIGESAFAGCSSLTSITIPSSVINIGNNIISYCENLETIQVDADNQYYTSIGNCLIEKETMTLIAGCNNSTIPNGIIKIGDEAFRGCTGLTDITIPEGITSIGCGAFTACSNITSIKIPESVSSIGELAFKGCESLESIEIPKSVTTIEYAVFSGCTSLESIKVPEAVTSIGDYAFLDCTSLVDIELPAGLTFIDRYAFSGCTSLESIEIPDGVTAIGEHAFSGCTNMTGVLLPASVTSIGTNGFECNVYYLGAIENISCDETVSLYYYREDRPIEVENFWYYNAEGEIVIWTDYYSEGLEYQISDDGTYYSVIGLGTCTDTDLVIPNLYEGLPVKNIAANAFKSKTKLTSVELFKGIQTIEASAFQSCIRITSLKAHNTITIGNYAFDGCSKLEIVDVIDGVEIIGENAFQNCTKLKSISLNEQMTWIPYYTFSGCANLTSIAIPVSVISIGNYAFNECTRLVSVWIPESVTVIDEGAFMGCTSLVNIELPEGLTFIGSFAFIDCVSLESITIPDNVTFINDSLFHGCTSLVSVEIPEGVTSIGEYAFDGCTSLASIKIPESVTSIGWYAFVNCTSLTSIEIPEGVTVIDESVFRGCTNLESVEIPAGVSSINNQAFYDCYNISSIYYHGTEEEWGDIVIGSFNEPLASATVYYYSETQPTEDGNWWHYNEDGEIEIWVVEPYTEGLIFTLSNDESYYIVGGLEKDCAETEIVIPSKYRGLPVTYIDMSAFYGCTTLTDIVIPDSIISIGVSAFEGCTSLVDIKIPESVINIRQFAFYGCTALTSVEMSDNVTELGSYAFAYCPALADIAIPAGVTSTPWSLFEGCDSLPSVVIPDGVTSIGNAAFAQCYALEYIVIPSSVTKIGDAAFTECDSLKAVYYGGTKDEWNAIEISTYKNNIVTAATRYYYTETHPTEDGNWWHYDENGEIEIWT